MTTKLRLSKKEKKKRNILLVTVVVVALLAGIGGWYVYDTSPLTGVWSFSLGTDSTSYMEFSQVHLFTTTGVNKLWGSISTVEPTSYTYELLENNRVKISESTSSWGIYSYVVDTISIPKTVTLTAVSGTMTDFTPGWSFEMTYYGSVGSFK